jgi:hypothetical protein
MINVWFVFCQWNNEYIVLNIVFIVLNKIQLISYEWIKAAIELLKLRNL